MGHHRRTLSAGQHRARAPVPGPRKQNARTVAAAVARATGEQVAVVPAPAYDLVAQEGMPAVVIRGGPWGVPVHCAAGCKFGPGSKWQGFSA
eukprot:10925805-Alexandrium_andersonii.AAC.1